MIASNADSERLLKALLRLIGSSSLLAVIFVAAPHRWMDSIHDWLGMGPLVRAPVVGYLARSTSALYALLGGLFWVLSFDLARYRPVLRYLGVALASFGAAILVVDWYEDMPLYWKIWEGPFVLAFGFAVLWLQRGIRPAVGRGR